MLCELCGKEQAKYVGEVEDVLLALCNECKQLSKNVRPIKQEKKVKKKEIQKYEEEDVIINDFAEIIRKKRESLALTQEELAKKVNEKLSIIKKIETNQLRPSLNLAKKLERLLNINLIEKTTFGISQGIEQRRQPSLTLGDIIKIRKKKTD